jgi:cholesterol oxidase
LGLLVEPCDPSYWENRHPDLRAAHITRYYGKIRSDLCTTRLTRQHPVPNSVWVELPGLAGQRCHPADPQPESAYLFPQFDTDAGRIYENGAGLPRRICAFNGDGILGSRDGAKSSVDFAYLAPVLNDRVTVRALCEARQVVREPDSAGGGYVVHYRDLHEKRNSTARAKRVVLAAGTMNTLQLLLEGQRRNGLAAMPSLGSTFGGNGDAIGAYFKNSAGPSTLPAPPLANLGSMGQPRHSSGWLRAAGSTLYRCQVGQSVGWSAWCSSSPWALTPVRARRTVCGAA